MESRYEVCTERRTDRTLDSRPGSQLEPPAGQHRDPATPPEAMCSCPTGSGDTIVSMEFDTPKKWAAKSSSTTAAPYLIEPQALPPRFPILFGARRPRCGGGTMRSRAMVESGEQEIVRLRRTERSRLSPNQGELPAMKITRQNVLRRPQSRFAPQVDHRQGRHLQINAETCTEVRRRIRFAPVPYRPAHGRRRLHRISDTRCWRRFPAGAADRRCARKE